MIVSNPSYNAANQLLGTTLNRTNETRGYNLLNQLTPPGRPDEGLRNEQPTRTATGHFK